MADVNTRILVVEDTEPFRTILTKYLNRSGFQVIEAESGEQAVALFSACRPALVLTDVMLPHMDGVALLRHLKEIDRNAIVIVMTGYGNEHIILESLRGGAVNFFPKPLDLPDLVQTIKKTLSLRYEETPRDFSPHLQSERKQFKFQTRETNLAPIVNQVAAQLLVLVDEGEIINMKVGIEEMLLNAIEHGNLRITAEEKREAIEKGTFGDLYRERVAQGNLGDRSVHVESRLDRDTFSITIEDEGDGFDWRAVPEPSAENLYAYTGRGIFLAKIAFDEVRYNQTGNTVTLLKRTSVTRSSAADDPRAGAA